jgi:hypothetical protein
MYFWLIFFLNFISNGFVYFKSSISFVLISQPNCSSNEVHLVAFTYVALVELVNLINLICLIILLIFRQLLSLVHSQQSTIQHLIVPVNQNSLSFPKVFQVKVCREIRPDGWKVILPTDIIPSIVQSPWLILWGNKLVVKLRVANVIFNSNKDTH